MLRLTAPADLGRALFDVIGGFLDAHPQLSVEMDLSNRIVNLVEEGFDCAIRAGSLPDSSLVARRLLPETGIGVFVSREYADRHGTPQTPADLERHDCLIYGTSGAGVTWVLEGEDGVVRVKPRPRLVINDFAALKAATLAGIGAALLPSLICTEELREGRLVRLFPKLDWGRDGAIWLVYPSREHMPTKIRAFADHLKTHFAGHFLGDRGA